MLKEGNCRLRYRQQKIEGARYHELTCRPRNRRNIDNIIIRLYFDINKYRHVMIEYTLMGDVDPGECCIEKFGGFRNINGLTIPANYIIEQVPYRSIHATRWIVQFDRMAHNDDIEPALFQAP